MNKTFFKNIATLFGVSAAMGAGMATGIIFVDRAVSKVSKKIEAKKPESVEETQK